MQAWIAIADQCDRKTSTVNATETLARKMMRRHESSSYCFTLAVRSCRSSARSADAGTGSLRAPRAVFAGAPGLRRRLAVAAALSSVGGLRRGARRARVRPAARRIGLQPLPIRGRMPWPETALWRRGGGRRGAELRRSASEGSAFTGDAADDVCPALAQMSIGASRAVIPIAPGYDHSTLTLTLTNLASKDLQYPGVSLTTDDLGVTIHNPDNYFTESSPTPTARSTDPAHVRRRRSRTPRPSTSAASSGAQPRRSGGAARLRSSSASRSQELSKIVGVKQTRGGAPDPDPGVPKGRFTGGAGRSPGKKGAIVSDGDSRQTGPGPRVRLHRAREDPQAAGRETNLTLRSALGRPARVRAERVRGHFKGRAGARRRWSIQGPTRTRVRGSGGSARLPDTTGHVGLREERRPSAHQGTDRLHLQAPAAESGVQVWR